MTNDLVLTPGELIQNSAGKEHQLNNCSIRNIRKHVEYMRRTSSRWEGDRLPFNEGLLPYKKNDINGLFVFENKPHSFTSALKFQCAMQLHNLPFYTYSPKQDKCERIDKA